MEELRNLEKLLDRQLGPCEKITKVDISKLASHGVGSLMLKVKVMLEDQNGKQKFLHLMAKKIPAEEFLREAFDIQRTFRKEVAFYEVILPILDDFQREEGITEILDNFPKFYGARYNLNNSGVVDEDAVMLLEDLSVKGFKNINRAIGFDLNGTKKILQDLARFHGTVIALKLKQPALFNEKIRPQCTNFNFAKKGNVKAVFTKLKKLMQSCPEIAHLAENATSFLDKETPEDVREPFASLSHFDLWVNNILNQIDNEEIVKNIFIDFQVYGYRSVAYDVFFFLWTSVETEVLTQNLDEFILHYHQNLCNIVEHFKIDTFLFSYEKFLVEIRLAADFEFGHALLFNFILKFIKNLDGGVREQINEEIDDINPELKEKLIFMVNECAKRGWLH